MSKDQKIIMKRLQQCSDNRKDGPIEGDWLSYPDGEWRRIAAIWPEHVQPTITERGGSFYLGHGQCSYSGSLERAIKKDTLEREFKLRKADVWIFHHDQHRAHNGVHFDVPMGIWKVTN